MPTDGVNKKRRRFLVATTSVVGAVGAGFTAVPFIKSWKPSARAQADALRSFRPDCAF